MSTVDVIWDNPDKEYIENWNCILWKRSEGCL